MSDRRERNIWNVREYVPTAAREWIPADELDTRIARLCVREGSIDKDKRTVTAVITDPTVDTYEESIAVGAFDDSIAAFMRNPVLLPAHLRRLDSGYPAQIGSVLEVKPVGTALVAVVRFAETNMAEEWWKLYRGGDGRAFSVGFRADEAKTVNGIYTYTKATLRELSACSVPANSNCLVTDHVALKMQQWCAAETVVRLAQMEAAVANLKALMGRESEDELAGQRIAEACAAVNKLRAA
jgi:HK97 family phage prohead protease